MNNSIKSEIVKSEIDEFAKIEQFCHVIDSRILKNSKVYKGCWIVKSIMAENTFAGDGSKIDNCELSEFSRAGKHNHLYHVSLGRHTYTGQGTVIMHTKLGAFTSISWGVTIGASEHDFNRVTSHTFLYNPYDRLNDGKVYYDRFEKECEVGNDVWIGANATILRGVKIGDGAVVGANAMVTKDVPPYAIVAGNPAKVIKYRFEESIYNRLLKIKWWELEDLVIKQHCDLFAKNPDHKTLDEIELIVNSQKGL
ncbi:TPA: DapH/DapD/GlmU-related protein [Bacillus luti]